jgi:hypothetical protein
MRPEIGKGVTGNVPACALKWHLNLRAWYLSMCLSGCLATDTKIEREIQAFQQCIMQENQSETRKVFQV